MAIMTLPQFGSAPWTADFKRGEFTTALATRLPWALSRAERTVTSITLEAPSPSAASWRTREPHTRLQSGFELRHTDRPGRPIGQ